MQRLAMKKSVLDSALENATNTRARLSVSDQAWMDEFLQSVRDVETAATNVSAGMGGKACALGTAPTMKTVTQTASVRRRPPATKIKEIVP
jgi:hypothetical protein